MPAVSSLYRHPVKGLTPEPRDRLTVLDSGAVAGDRVLGFLRADAGPPVAGQWWPKERFVVLMNTPGLARLDVRFDEAAARLGVALDGATLVEGGLDPAGRERIAAAVTKYVLGLDDSPLRDHPERAPLSLVGDGTTPMLQDRGPRHVTLVGRASVESLAEAVASEVDERRFRMNVVVDGLDPWAELEWVGRSIRIGGVEFDVTGPVIRCLATHANPESGERDMEVMTTLTSVFGHDEPTMGVLAVPRSAGGTIAMGDAVTVGG